MVSKLESKIKELKSNKANIVKPINDDFNGVIVAHPVQNVGTTY